MNVFGLCLNRYERFMFLGRFSAGDEFEFAFVKADCRIDIDGAILRIETEMGASIPLLVPTVMIIALFMSTLVFGIMQF